jgi:hypothetical protein
MEFEAVVPYGSGKAWYRIGRENPGIYHAELLTCDGTEKQQPPAAITLIRAVRGWIGSGNDEILINELGRLIEANLLTASNKKNTDKR